ncbi:MAG: hypothetical protein HFJ41_02535 [Clostridia bacterium]|nr:hypothetical protein [Clostridia bacterium]
MKTQRRKEEQKSYIMVVNRSKEKDFFKVAKDAGIGSEYIKASFVSGDFVSYIIDFSSFNKRKVTELRTLLNSKIPELL